MTDHAASPQGVDNTGDDPLASELAAAMAQPIDAECPHPYPYLVPVAGEPRAYCKGCGAFVPFSLTG